MSPDVIKKAILHLKKDKNLSKHILTLRKPEFNLGRHYFSALVSSIIYQQLSGKVASTIEKRFRSLISGKLTPQKVLKLTNVQFKSSGVSPQKTKYIRDLSEKFLDGTINTSDFNKMNDEDIREHLVRVKGIGRWTADMFLMFTLNRLDVLPTGDLGIQKGFQKVFSMKSLPDAKKMEKLAENWRPYRTIASWYLWRAVEN